VSGSENPATSAEEQAAQRLAEKWELEFRESSAVAVDPRALSVLPGPNCRELRAVPLGLSGGNAVIGIADPSDERFDAIRSHTGTDTRFVVITERTLEALLHSRMFAGRSAGAHGGGASEPAVAGDELDLDAATAELERLDLELGIDMRPEAAAAGPPAAPAPEIVHVPTPVVVDESIVSAIVEALESRLASLPAPAPIVYEGGSGDGSAPELLAQIDASMATLATLRSSLDAMNAELEEARKSLRETKEQLSVAHAESDQYQHRVKALETEVAESRGLLGEARTRLQDAFEALGGATRVDTETDAY
jgi:hypothetical protein